MKVVINPNSNNNSSNNYVRKDNKRASYLHGGQLYESTMHYIDGCFLVAFISKRSSVLTSAGVCHLSSPN